MRRTRVVLFSAVAVAAVGAAAAGVWALALRDTSTPASVDEALRRFRAAAAAGPTPAPAGVYVYATTGSESVSALGGATHRYPARSTITVTPAPCGMALRWDVLTTRSDVRTVCTEDEDGLALASWQERHRFFGQDDRSEWRCTDTLWLPAAPPGSERPYDCRSGDTAQEGTVTVLPSRRVTVGGVEIEAVAVRVEARERGAARGTLVEERLLEPETGLPLRIEYAVATSNDSPIGDVAFEERYTLRLLSLRPRR